LYTAYVVNDQYPTSNSITAVTGSGSTWTPGTPLVLGSGAIGETTVAVSPDGSTAYQALGGENTIIPINTSTFTAGTAFSSGVTTPLDDEVTPNGEFLVVVGVGSNTVSVISTANTANVQTVTVGSSPTGLAILPNSSAAYVVNSGDNTVSVVSLVGTPTVTNTISFPGGGCHSPTYDAVTPNGKKVFVTCSGNDKLWKIKVATGHAAATGIKIPKGGEDNGNGGLHQVVITPDGHTAYVASGNDVYPVTLATKTVGSGIPMTNATSLAISSDGAYVMSGQSDNGCGCSTDNVEVIQVSTNTVTDTFSAGGYEHFSLAFKP
jgi:YVTN family beta-propeller protein